MFVISRTLLLSIFLIIFSVVLWLASNDIAEPASWQRFGSATFPRVLISILGGLSFILFLQELLVSEKTNAFPEIMKWIIVEYRILFGFGLFVFYIALMANIGFILATLIYLATTLLLFWQPFSARKFLISIVLCVAVTFSVHFVFEAVLAIRLP